MRNKFQNHCGWTSRFFNRRLVGWFFSIHAGEELSYFVGFKQMGTCAKNYELRSHTLPESNSSHLKMDGWNTILSFWDGPSQTLKETTFFQSEIQPSCDPPSRLQYLHQHKQWMPLPPLLLGLTKPQEHSGQILLH